MTHCFLNRILVGAPWDGPQNSRKGDIYKCIVEDETNSNCSKVNLGIGLISIYFNSCVVHGVQVYDMFCVILCIGENAFQNVSRNLKNSHLGMTLTPAASDGFLVRLYLKL